VQTLPRVMEGVAEAVRVCHNAATPMLDRFLRLAAKIETLLSRGPGLAILVLGLTVHAVALAIRRMGDFELYVEAARRLLAGGTVYSLDDPHRYLYAPLATFLFVPFAWLSEIPAKLGWTALTLAMVAVALRLSKALAVPEGRWFAGATLIVLAIAGRYIDNHLGHAQVNIILFVLVLAAYRLAARGRAVLAGFLLATAIVTKLYPAVLLVQLFFRREWRFLFATVAGSAVVMLAPALWWQEGYDEVVLGWIAVVVDQMGHYELGNKINQSIAAFVYRLFYPHPGGSPLFVLAPTTIAALTVVVHLAFLVPIAVLSARRARQTELPAAGDCADELALYLLYATVAAPYSWKHYYVTLLLPLAALVWRLRADDRRAVAIVLGFTFLASVLPGSGIFGKHGDLFLQLNSTHFLSVVVLFGALLVRAFREDREVPAEGT